MSTATDPISNTTQSHEEKKRSKRRFMAFTNVLLKFLERKDPTVFEKAHEVIRNCEEKKKRGDKGFESVTESLRTPLKQVVGPSYWKQARGYVVRRKQQAQHSDVEPLCPTAMDQNLSPHDSAFLEQSLLNASQEEQSPLATRACSTLEEEHKLQKDRFWILIRVLMKFLEQKEPKLYLTAKATIMDCVRRHRKREDGFKSLSGTIQVRVKKVVGVGYWRKAESFLSKIILQKAREAALDEDMWMHDHHQPFVHMTMGGEHDHQLEDVGRMMLWKAAPPVPAKQQQQPRTSQQTIGGFGARGIPPKRSLSPDKELPRSTAMSCSARGMLKTSPVAGSDRKRRRIHGLH